MGYRTWSVQERFEMSLEIHDLLWLIPIGMGIAFIFMVREYRK